MTGLRTKNPKARDTCHSLAVLYKCQTSIFKIPTIYDQ